jgi:hypothetical protein
MPTPSRPWRLALITPGAPVYMSHRSEKAVYEAAEREQARAADPAGGSRVTRISIQQWDDEAGRWALYENIWRRGA